MNIEKPSQADRFIGTMAEKVGAIARAATDFCEPVERDGITVIPRVVVCHPRNRILSSRGKPGIRTKISGGEIYRELATPTFGTLIGFRYITGIRK